ncbi:MAG: GNAT family N-acetyltransferase [Puniceicoccales bacterium]|jgi:RimJ/RimL family protein N-acetyltransferase|nr:GNAT family N-acetyltransferase [Puniceicoccales bacterium]
MQRKYRPGKGILWMAIMGMVLGLWGTYRYKPFGKSCCGKKVRSAIQGNPIHGVLGKNDAPIPSQRVIDALEARKHRPAVAKDSRLYSLSLAPDLGTENLLLRAIEERDFDDFTAILEDYETVYMLAYMPWPFGPDRVQKYLKGLSREMEYGVALYWAITLPEEDHLIGVIGLTLEHEHDRGELHFWLSKKYRRRGYMTEAAKRVRDYFFRDLSMNRLDVNHLSINMASQRVIEKCGFIFECEREAYAKKEGKYENLKFYRLLRREYMGANGKN